MIVTTRDEWWVGSLSIWVFYVKYKLKYAQLVAAGKIYKQDNKDQPEGIVLKFQLLINFSTYFNCWHLFIQSRIAYELVFTSRK